MRSHQQLWIAVIITTLSALIAGAVPGPVRTTGTPGQLHVLVGMGMGSIDIDGNLRRFEQYVTPPEGPYLSEVGVRFLSPTGSVLLEGTVRDFGAPTVQGDLWLSVFNGSAVLTGQQRRSQFYRDWTESAGDFKRNDSAYELMIPAGKGELRVGYDAVSLVGPEEDWVRSVPGASLVAPLGSWQGTVGYGTESFTFHGGPQLTGDTNVLTLGLSAPYSDRTAFEANAALLETSLDNFVAGPGGSKIAVRGVHQAGPGITLSGEVTRDEITDAVTRNAYARRDQGGELRATFRTLPRTTVEVGGGRRRVDYVNGNQSGIFQVDENSVFARATSRLSRQLRLRVSHEQIDTEDRPTAVGPLDVPVPSLIWSERKDSRAELAFTPAPRLGFTGTLRKLHWNNADQGTENSLVQHGVYAWWLPRDAVTLYAGYLRQNFDLNGTPFVGGPYDTDTETAVVGASYQVSPRLLLDLSLSDADATGAESSAQRVVALGASYELPIGAILSVRGVWDDFDTAVNAPDEDYDGDWFELSLSKFLF